MKKATHVFMLIALPFLMYGQNWQRFAGDSTLNINSVYFDSSSSTLYANAYIIDIAGDTIHTPCIWNGNNFNKIGDFNFSPSHGLPRAIISYHNEIYIGGDFNKYNIAPGDYFLKLDPNNSWDTANISPNFEVLSLGILDDTLIVMGGFSGIGNVSSRSIAKYANSTWTPMETGLAQLQYVRSMCSYNDSIIFSGNCGGDYLVPFDGNVLAYYQDSIFPFDRGIDIGSSTGVVYEGILCSVVYNGELYVAGAFDSNFGKSILKWNGTTWVDISYTPGVVPPFSVRAMAVYNNELYVGGSFVYIGGVYASHIAKWDGHKWCGLGSYINGAVNTIFVYNNELIISGEFNSIDGVYFNSIAKWVGGSYVDTCQSTIGIEEVNSSSLKIFPNPTTNKLTIEVNSGTIQKITIYDLRGKLINTISCNTSKQELDISTLAPGLYFLDAVSDQRTFRKRFVKN